MGDLIFVGLSAMVLGIVLACIFIAVGGIKHP